MLTTTERGDLAEQLLPIAARLSCLVHGDGDQRDIHQTIARLGQDERDALLIVLAGLVDPEAPVADALRYLTWDEHGRPAAPGPLAGTIRSLADTGEWPLVGWLSEDMLRWERERTLRAAARRGETHSEIGVRLGVSSKTVERWLAAS
jgi:DNA-binding NarL/FixJ family response regulator